MNVTRIDGKGAEAGRALQAIKASSKSGQLLGALAEGVSLRQLESYMPGK
jgi:hypothetical protein